MNATGLGQGQRLEKLQQGLMVFSPDSDVVGMFRDCHIGTQDLDSFLFGEIPLGPELIEHGGAFFTSSRATLRCVSPMGYKQRSVAVYHYLRLFGIKNLLFPLDSKCCV
jgi:hypothetical protein